VIMNYLCRNIDDELLRWKNTEHRKVLLLRGARQVGKSSAVRELGKKFEYFVEVNLERDDREKGVKAIFEKGLDVNEFVMSWHRCTKRRLSQTAHCYS